MEQINAIVDEIWGKYDADDSGKLDKEEAFKLAIETAGAINPDAPVELQRSVFDEIFSSIDKDGSGEIVKVEMAHFLKKFIP